ncbi:hypothetical protein BP6252_03781 [Coleophoma cylindrospora]|uniref:C2H2-type domain-containing protein n=1 Tax=Coleophoma cylindrospora TaxID=1849047 RepID=A0A3D8S8J7_9HELO|nr:hypothetical protein BP6252_03781 [Coleophoma cylindrospora]
MDLNNADSTATGTSEGQKFTCQLCTTSFQDNATQRSHMKSPWHVYNLKRTLSKLGPITLERFADVENHKKNQVTEYSTDLRWRCSTCQKDYHNEKTYKSHLRSRNHLQQLTFLDSDGEPELESTVPTDQIQRLASVARQLETFNISDASSSETEEDEVTDFDSVDYLPYDDILCIFCRQKSASLSGNLSHMYEKHGLYIQWPEYAQEYGPRSDYLNSLHIYIYRFHGCLKCGTRKHSVEAIKTHMLAKGHCSVPAEDVEEFFEDYWEEGDVENGRPEIAKKIEISAGNEGAFILPSGKMIHHRSTLESRQKKPRFYDGERARKLLLKESGAEEEGLERSESGKSTSKQLAVRRSDLQSLIGISPGEKRGLMVAERKMLKVETRARNSFQAKMALKNNRQKYYRPDGPSTPLG